MVYISKQEGLLVISITLTNEVMLVTTTKVLLSSHRKSAYSALIGFIALFSIYLDLHARDIGGR